MQIHELKDQLKRKIIQPIYIFTGEEIAIMKIYTNKIAEVMGVNPTRVDSVGGIYANLQRKSIMDMPKCYIIMDDKEYMSLEKIWDTINAGKVQGKSTIILVFSNLDKRTKFYKQHKDLLTEFNKLTAPVLAKYINKDIGLSGKKAEQFAELCECNYSRIILEGDKLMHLAKANNISIEDAYDRAIEQNLIYVAPGDVIFEMVDAVCKRDAAKSFRLLLELEEVNQSPLAIISLVYNNIRAMLLVQSAGNGSDLANRTGLTGWQIKLAKEKGNNYHISELVRALREIREVERGIKTGLVPQDIAVNYLLSIIL